MIDCACGVSLSAAAMGSGDGGGDIHRHHRRLLTLASGMDMPLTAPSRAPADDVPSHDSPFCAVELTQNRSDINSGGVYRRTLWLRVA